ncbi:MAG: hypothetical protein DRP00_03660 [Candidatus Aenigmatarchaeota archaeon]|nr:MAG: hypothetical protein DRP00_03660 [Candidatus Aenigmarchaeota archaeon]
MLIEYERLWFAGGIWIIELLYSLWIYEDSKRFNAKAWPWLAAMFIIRPLRGDPIARFLSAYYDWYILPSRGVEWYKTPFFAYDTSQMVEPIWVLDFYLLWDAFTGALNTTIAVYIAYWIYRDAKRSDIRATPWIFMISFLPNLSWPLDIVLPFGGFAGIIAILCGYLLRKLGYI